MDLYIDIIRRVYLLLAVIHVIGENEQLVLPFSLVKVEGFHKKIGTNVMKPQLGHCFFLY